MNKYADKEQAIREKESQVSQLTDEVTTEIDNLIPFFTDEIKSLVTKIVSHTVKSQSSVTVNLTKDDIAEIKKHTQATHDKINFENLYKLKDEHHDFYDHTICTTLEKIAVKILFACNTILTRYKYRTFFSGSFYNDERFFHNLLHDTKPLTEDFSKGIKPQLGKLVASGKSYKENRYQLSRLKSELEKEKASDMWDE